MRSRHGIQRHSAAPPCNCDDVAAAAGTSTAGVSANLAVEHRLHHFIPRNMLCTWSMRTEPLHMVHEHQALPHHAFAHRHPRVQPASLRQCWSVRQHQRHKLPAHQDQNCRLGQPSRHLAWCCRPPRMQCLCRRCRSSRRARSSAGVALAPERWSCMMRLHCNSA